MARAIPLSSLPDETVGEALRHVSKNLRADDLNELLASVGGDPEEVLKVSVGASSHAWLIVDRSGLPIGAFGAAPSPIPTVGIPWLMGTAEIELEALSVARQTRPYVAEIQDAYPVLTNFVDVRNDLAIHWLSWSGFSFIDADPRYGVEGRPFLQFSRTSRSV